MKGLSADTLRTWCLTALLTAVASPVLAQNDLGSLPSDVAGLQGEITRLQTEYVQPQTLNRELNLAGRVAEGQLRYFLEDWEAAAIILVDVVENRQFRSLAGWDDARYLLADSLFETRNYTLARGYFEEIVSDNDATWSLDATRRLLEIALALNEYERLDELFAAMQQRAGALATPEISYVRGKSYYQQERDDEALAAMSAVPPDHRLYNKAQYFVGVTLARLARYEESLAAFTALGERLTEAADPSDNELRDLTLLAVGRLHYEIDQWAQARMAYESVASDSQHYDIAIYELAWTQIRQGSIREAIRTLELLEVVAVNARYGSEAALLRGDLYMRLDRYDAAVGLFENVADRFAPAEAELQALIGGGRSPRDFFETLIDPETDALRLPTEIQPWFESEDEVDRVLMLVADRDDMLADVEECRTIIAELDAVLSGAEGAGLFPVFREGWGRATELRSRVVTSLAALADAEAALVAPRLGGADRTQYDRVHGERMQLQGQYLNAPRTFDQLADAATRSSNALNETELDVFRSAQEIEGLLDELAALQRFVQRQALSRQRTQGEATRLLQELATVQQELEAERDRSEVLAEAVRIRQIRVNTSADAPAEVQDLRNAYLNAIRAEREILRAGRSQAGGNAAFAEIDALQEQLSGVETAIDRFFNDISGLVAEQTSEVRAILEEERAAMNRYEEVLARNEESIDLLAGEVAYAAFLRVQDRFSSLTMRANLGILDVAWRQKEDVSDQISDLFDERDREYRILDADFAEIREER
jgi:hypothetical protein